MKAPARPPYFSGLCGCCPQQCDLADNLGEATLYLCTSLGCLGIFMGNLHSTTEPNASQSHNWKTFPTQKEG